MRWDSNPRYSFEYDSLVNCCRRPLGYSSLVLFNFSCGARWNFSLENFNSVELKFSGHQFGDRHCCASKPPNRSNPPRDASHRLAPQFFTAFKTAEPDGFEPSVPYKGHTSLAKMHVRPLRHGSVFLRLSY
jgi:hypothetical protein